MKKGESISMSVIIIAAIALLVLVVLAVLVLRATQQTQGGTGCAGSGGRCADECESYESQDFARSGTLGQCRTGEVCCRTVGTNPDAEE